MARIKSRIPVVQCKTRGCETDLDYMNAAVTGTGALPPFDPNEPYRVMVSVTMPHPGELTCPVCKKTQQFSNEDIRERAVLEPEVGDIVCALGESGRFELLEITPRGTAKLRLLGEGPKGPVELRYVIDVPFSVVSLLRPKQTADARN